MTELKCQKRSFLSWALLSLEALKTLVPQTLGKTSFDFGTFLATARNRTFVRPAASGKMGSFQSFAALRKAAEDGFVFMDATEAS